MHFDGDGSVFAVKSRNKSEKGNSASMSANQGGKNDGEDSEALAYLSATATKMKLDKLMNDFQSFDDTMRIGTRVRASREDDEYCDGK